jgi:hypothetical protein
MKRTKSFQYDDLENPKVHQWIIDLEKEGKNFSGAVRRLIEGKDDTLRREIEDIKRQIEILRQQGIRVEIHEEPEFAASTESLDDSNPALTVSNNFVKNRYFDE